MTNKEILAELKRSYEYLLDITENGSELHCCGQMKKDLISRLEIAKNEIEEVYFDFYNKVFAEEELSIPKKYQTLENQTILISSAVNGDYDIRNNGKGGIDDFLTCADIDYFWYQDEEFLERDDSDEDNSN